MNSTLMTCTMPEVQLPSDFEVNGIVNHHESVTSGRSDVAMRGGDDDGRSLSVSVGLQFDGYRINLPDNTFQYFQPPTFNIPTNVIVYRPDSFSHVDIEV